MQDQDHHRKFIIITKLDSSNNDVHYTDYAQFGDVNDNDAPNYYWGCAHAFQVNGQTKKYKVENGILKLESSTYIGPRREDGGIDIEERNNPANWDVNNKVFITPILRFQRARNVNFNEIDEVGGIEEGEFLIKFNGMPFKLVEGQTITFGDYEHQQVQLI